MYKNPCLRAPKYIQIQTASLCVCGLLCLSSHLDLCLPGPEDPGYPTADPRSVTKAQMHSGGLLNGPEKLPKPSNTIAMLMI